MKLETITEQGDLVIRRMILAPGETMYWHTDTCRRFSVIVSGSKLAIEYRDSGDREEFDVAPGMVGWDDPEDRVHRAINAGSDDYEEVVTFHRSSAAIDPQPRSV